MSDIEKRNAAPLAAGMFGGVEDVPQNAAPPTIGIDKDKAKFDVGDDTLAKEITGHILWTQEYNRLYLTKFDPNNPEPPACFSSNGRTPTGGESPCSGPCATCPNNQWTEDESGNPIKPCANRMVVFFIKDGDVLPSILDLTGASLSPKQDGGIMSFYGKAMNKANAAGVGQCYQPVKVELTLMKKDLPKGPTSILCVSCKDVVTDPAELKRLSSLYKHVIEKQAQETMDEVISSQPQDDVPI